MSEELERRPSQGRDREVCPPSMQEFIDIAAKSGCKKSQRAVIIMRRAWEVRNFQYDDAEHPVVVSKRKRYISAKRLEGTWTEGHRVVATGTNRPMVGECDGSDACRSSCREICVHAEQAALVEAGPVRARGAEVFHLKVAEGQPVASGVPSCVQCSKAMLLAEVAGVWLLQRVVQLLPNPPHRVQVDRWVRWTAEEFHVETLKTLGLKSP
jgi:hypothetical protein